MRFLLRSVLTWEGSSEDTWVHEQVPVSAMMGGTVTVVIHTALSTVVTAFLRTLVETITGTDVVISAQTGLRSVTNMTGVCKHPAVSECVNSLVSAR